MENIYPCVMVILCVKGLDSGSYLVEVEHPDYMYEPVRVDINSKGKHRARKNNLVQPSQVKVNGPDILYY